MFSVRQASALAPLPGAAFLYATGLQFSLHCQVFRLTRGDRWTKRTEINATIRDLWTCAHEAKTGVRIIDFVDVDHPALMGMWEERRRGYRAMGYRIAGDRATGDDAPLLRELP